MRTACQWIANILNDGSSITFQLTLK